MTAIYASETSEECLVDRHGPAVTALASAASPGPGYDARRVVRSADPGLPSGTPDMTTFDARKPSGECTDGRDVPAVTALTPTTSPGPGYNTRCVVRSADPAGLPYGTLDMIAIYGSETSGAGLVGRYRPAVAGLASAASLDSEYDARWPVGNAAAVRSAEPLT
jgi:hypothetical protein